MAPEQGRSFQQLAPSPSPGSFLVFPGSGPTFGSERTRIYLTNAVSIEEHVQTPQS